MKKKFLAIIILSLYVLSMFAVSAFASIPTREPFKSGRFMTEEYIYIPPKYQYLYTDEVPCLSGFCSVVSKDGEKREFGDYIATGDTVVYKGEVLYTFICPGDLNCDGLISSEDARISLRYAVGLESVESFEMMLAADVVYSCTFDSADARNILLYSVGKLSIEEFYYENRVRYYPEYQEKYFSVEVSGESRIQEPENYTPEFFDEELVKAVHYKGENKCVLELKEPGRDNMDRLIFKLTQQGGLSFVLPGTASDGTVELDAFSNGAFFTEEHIYIRSQTKYTGKTAYLSGFAFVTDKDGKELELDECIATGDTLVYNGELVYTFVCMGDVDGDGWVTPEDSVIALRFAEGIESPGSLAIRLAADLDSSYVLDLNDSLAIMKRATDNDSSDDFYYDGKVRYYEKFQEKYLSVRMSDESKLEKPEDYTAEFFNGDLVKAVHYNSMENCFILELKEPGRDNMDRLMFSIMEKSGLSIVSSPLAADS